jgi:hypothetical protein
MHIFGNKGVDFSSEWHETFAHYNTRLLYQSSQFSSLSLAHQINKNTIGEICHL